jgi:hypothetical protein
MFASLTPLTGQSLGGRPVTETVMLVNMGNQPHRDYGEGLPALAGCPLPAFNRLPTFGRLPDTTRSAGGAFIFLES